MHPNVARVESAAAALGLSITPKEFEGSTRTAADAAAMIGVELAQIVKSLVFAVDDQLVLALVSGANLLDERALAREANATVAHRVDAETVREATGFPVGGVPPFGFKRDLPVFFDPDLLAFDVVWAAAGTPHVNFAIDPRRLADAVGATVAPIGVRPGA